MLMSLVHLVFLPFIRKVIFLIFNELVFLEKLISKIFDQPNMGNRKTFILWTHPLRNLVTSHKSSCIPNVFSLFLFGSIPVKWRSIFLGQEFHVQHTTLWQVLLRNNFLHVNNSSFVCLFAFLCTKSSFFPIERS